MSMNADVKKGCNVVWRISSVDRTLAAKPHFNAYACGCGPHGDVKYNRAKSQRAWKKDAGLL